MSDQAKTDLWERVKKTDPKYTKKVTFGRGFTAIDPYYQIRRATCEWGPAGDRWGWKIRDIQHLPSNQVAVLVQLWHPEVEGEEGAGFVEQWGQNGIYTDAKMTKPDGDCMKKATTDAITKCLSYLGFSADVFLGQFDDNKYVAETNREFREAEKFNDAVNSPVRPDSGSGRMANNDTPASDGSAKPVDDGAVPDLEDAEWFQGVIEKIMQAETPKALQQVYMDTVTRYTKITNAKVKAAYEEAMGSQKRVLANREAVG